MEYASVVWDPHQRKDIDKLERVQRRMARYVTGRWHNTSSVTSMLQDLQWRSLKERRRLARLTLMYKVVHGHVAIDQGEYRPAPPPPSFS